MAVEWPGQCPRCERRGLFIHSRHGSVEPPRVRVTDDGWDWGVARWVGVDAGTCFFGDTSALLPDEQLPTSYLPSGSHDARVLVDDGIASVVCATGGDIEMPVDLGRDVNGRAAARMCFSNDIDRLDGSWTPVGELTLSGNVAARDPCCRGELYRSSFELPPGRYRAEIFRPAIEARECLGLRVVQISDPF